jgi:hypothetical protein
MGEAVLNSVLYRKLVRHFGEVKVKERGEEMVFTSFNHASGRSRLAISHAGETYWVCCPFCGDRRFRLGIGYQYGQRDDLGRHMTFLACCFNETACMSDRANQADFYDTLSANTSLTKATLRKGIVVPEDARIAPLPGATIRIDKLDERHRARLYLKSRGFDPDKLGRVYKVAYCPKSHWSLASDRIIIPVIQSGKLRGWQARYIGEINKNTDSSKRKPPPKYFTMPGMKKSRLLYNLDQARQYRTGVIVEGASDVWSVGPMAVCTFGCCMSSEQRKLFLVAFRKRTAVLLYDPEALEEAQVVKVIEDFKEVMPGRFAVVKLPDNYDPGDLSRESVRDEIAIQAEEQGVKVSFSKRKT